MKLEAAISKAKIIAERIKQSNGLIGTPECSFEAYRIKRAWLFGSTAKGKDNPNDVDILIEAREAGRPQRTQRNKSYTKDRRFNRACNARIDKQYYRSYGMIRGICTYKTAQSFLRGHLKMVRFHSIEIDGEIAYPRILIYPRMDLP
jgi:predicted nucleotidyltransferase